MMQLEEDEELEVLLGGVAGVEQVGAVGRQRPVVVLARAVDAGKGLLVLQAHQAVVAGKDLHELHDQQVVVDGDVGLLEHGCELVLGGGDLVVLGLGGDGELPELLVELLHKTAHRGADGAEVVLLELLALGGCGAEKGTPGEDEVGALGVVLLLDEEVLLLGAHGGDHAYGVAAEEAQHAARLVAHGVHGAQQRRLLVERLAGIAHEGRGDAEHVVFDEGRARGVPGGVATRLEGGADAAGGEARGVGLALDELFAREGHDGGAVGLGVEEGVVLLTRDARERLEPVGVVGRPLFDRPLLHGVGHDVGHLDVEGRPLLDGLEHGLVGDLGELLAHHLLAEYPGSVDLARIDCHGSHSLSVGRVGGVAPWAARRGP